jgi:hypothetical protein
VSKARVMYVAILALIVLTAILPAFSMFTDGAHDGNAF